jgi:hemerythrin-like domain-containing protein
MLMAARQPEDAIAMLTADHQRVRELFQRYEGTKAWNTKQQIAEQVFTALDTHAQLEEQVFYPAFETQAGKKGTQLVAESRQAHQVVTDLVAALRDLAAEDTEFAVKFRELMDHVETHVQEEETALFPEAAEILADQMASLTQEMQALQQQLTASHP